MKIKANTQLAKKIYDLSLKVANLNWIVNTDWELKDEEVWKHFEVAQDKITELIQLIGETRGHILKHREEEE